MFQGPMISTQPGSSAIARPAGRCESGKRTVCGAPSSAAAPLGQLQLLPHRHQLDVGPPPAACQVGARVVEHRLLMDCFQQLGPSPQVLEAPGQRSCGALRPVRASAPADQRQSSNGMVLVAGAGEGIAQRDAGSNFSCVVLAPGQPPDAAGGLAPQQGRGPGPSAFPNVVGLACCLLHPKRLAFLAGAGRGLAAAVAAEQAPAGQRARQGPRPSRLLTRAPFGCSPPFTVLRDMAGRWQGSTSGWERSQAWH